MQLQFTIPTSSEHLCECGCGTLIRAINARGRVLHFATGHHLAHKQVKRPLDTRFWSKVEKTETCWLWVGSRNSDGYGMIYNHDRHKTERTHRVAYELQIGTIPAGLQVLHHCDNPPCVRPDHLWLGVPADNDRDKIAKGRAGWQIHPQLQDGERNNAAKLTWAQVDEIRRMRIEGWTQQRIADHFGVARPTISSIVSGKRWSEMVYGANR